MDDGVILVHAREEPPDRWDAAVFLAGPTPRTPGVASWRPDAHAELRARWRGGGRLVVFDPEHREDRYDDYDGQVEWEERCLHLADEVVFWVPRDLATMPAFTTNVEWGMWHDSGRVVFGAPPEAPKNGYLLHYADKSAVPTAAGLPETVAAALRRIGAGASRASGEREVPLLLWRDAAFQRWYAGQRDAGNVLLGARVVFRFGVCWGLHVRVRVTAEDRVKDNEIVIGRPDISAVVLYRPGATLDATQVVLVREFRSAGADGDVHELPGGSGPGGPAEVALAEVAEETGLVLEPARLRGHRSRQVNATLSAHRAHLFSAEVTAAELERIRGSGPHGVAAAGERTYVVVAPFGRIRREGLVDAANLGMIAEVLLETR
ncbi:8-oxo-dGTP pyrophosphatase MutT (NUDIX family) [Actinomadura luteofluorescens]|uniref:8-oxo-dGTP pyrophosphatase MutT (NUDIX family) n=1 Tax=Actinomadura luteofluorescens TaxID=46163 RepID=A0A7Y9JE83_9ACTN|nr:nucleoside 2-deoxyribosyltransferase domain-containing protein [Actinomadura luteofluorescens]NYD45201.1 8-oxo-dGTP pyrophosphatase MutT (NUDIX family) [Actinomadura luteofluorescens]